MIHRTILNRVTNKIFNNYAKDSGKLLVHVGTGVTVIGASAQIGMLLSDRKMEKHTKKFLVNQEAITSGACIAMYYSICESVRIGVNKALEGGKVLTETVAKSIAGLNKENKNIKAEDWKNIFTKKEMKKGLSYNLEHIEETDFYKNSKDVLKKQIKEAAKKSSDIFQNYKSGVSILAVLAASVFAGNIAGPVIGNYLVSFPVKKDTK